MKKGANRSISRIRTFNEDVARAQGIETPKEPTLKKEQETVQSIADTILNTQTRKATDFMADDTDHAEVLTPDMEVEVDIPAEEIAATHRDVPIETKMVPQPPVNNLVVAELEEDIRSVGKIHTQSVQTTEGAVYDVSNNDLTEGTLITNKKTTKHRLLPSIFVALTSWFRTTKTELTAPKKPERTVSSAQSRIETITAAARASKHAPHNDHGVMVKRLTKTKKHTPVKAVKITKKENLAAPQWGSSDDEKLHVKDATETVIPEAAQIEIPEPAEVVPEVQVTPESGATLEPIIPEPEAATPPVEKTEKVSRKKRTYKATPGPVSGVSIYVYILVIIGASMLGIGVSVYWFMSSTPSQEAVIIRIPSLFTSSVQVPVTLSSNSVDTLSTILDLSVASRETTQIYPVTVDATGTQIPAQTQTTLSALGFRAPGSFTRAVTDITFGSYNGTDPFILMKVTNFDTAFGGILDWEPDMSADLSPLFGIPVSQSYDPYSRTDTQVRSAFFRDTIVANKSARLLVDAQDDERLMYAFVRPNLILITTNSEAFNAVLPLITQ